MPEPRRTGAPRFAGSDLCVLPDRNRRQEEQARSLLTVAFVAEALEKAGKAGEPFRDALDHALLDSLRTRLPGGSHA